MKKIVFFTKYSRNGASSRLRTLQYLDRLGDEIGDIVVSPLFTEVYLKKLYAREKISKLYVLKRYLIRLGVFFKYFFSADIFYIEKELLPYMPAFLEWLIKGRYVCDYDDAIFHNYDLHRKSILRRLLGNKIANVMKYAKAVVVGNEYLKNYAINSGSTEIVKIPTVISKEKYKVKTNENQVLNIGWIGTPNTQKYVEDLFPIFEELSKQFNFKLSLIGANKKLFDEVSFNLEVIKWSEDTEVSSLQKIDIGIMPLPDEPFERGKCGYKLIQYMALGKPVVASNVGVNSEIVQGNGYLVSDKQGWKECLEKLTSSQQLRESFGKKSRNLFLENYSLESKLTVFRSLFDDLSSI